MLEPSDAYSPLELFASLRLFEKAAFFNGTLLLKLYSQGCWTTRTSTTLIG